MWPWTPRKMFLWDITLTTTRMNKHVKHLYITQLLDRILKISYNCMVSLSFLSIWLHLFHANIYVRTSLMHDHRDLLPLLIVNLCLYTFILGFQYQVPTFLKPVSPYSTPTPGKTDGRKKTNKKKFDTRELPIVMVTFHGPFLRCSGLFPLTNEWLQTRNRKLIGTW